MNRWICLGLAALLVACERNAPEPASTVVQTVVDSILPVEEEIRRFTAELPAPLPAALDSVATSREELARRYIDAVERRDTAALRGIVLNAGEFIALYYPHSQYTEPPYKQSPAFLWFLIQQNSQKGISRVLDRFGGEPAGFRALECQAEPVVQEHNRLWDCTVRWKAASGKPDPVRLFGTILERDGRFKFLSFANGF